MIAARDGLQNMWVEYPFVQSAPLAATESMFGVGISGQPLKPTSPYPKSSAKITTIFGCAESDRAGDAIIRAQATGNKDKRYLLIAMALFRQNRRGPLRKVENQG